MGGIPVASYRLVLVVVTDATHWPYLYAISNHLVHVILNQSQAAGQPNMLQRAVLDPTSHTDFAHGESAPRQSRKKFNMATKL